MGLKEGRLERPLSHINGRRPSWIDFDGIGNAVSRYEVETIDSEQAEFRRDAAGLRRCRLEQRAAASELRIVERGEDAAAIPKTVPAEVRIANELTRKAERDTVAAGSNKDDRPGCALYSLLQV